jgi:proton-translocating NADH-quinone oxidoreductase chain N
MVALAADIGGKRLGPWRAYVSGGIAIASIVISLVLVLSEWGSIPLLTYITPNTLPASSLYLVDRYTTLVTFAVLVVGLAVSVFSLRYLGPKEHVGPFFALLLVLLCSLVGVASAGDFLTLFLFWEGMSVCAYGLVAFSRSQLSVEAAIKYFLMAGIGSLLALYGIAAIFSVTQSISLASIPRLFAPPSALGELGLALLLVGLGVEAAVVPLHTWLPDVYSAAALPVATVISGAVTAVGVFALSKVIQPLFMTPIPIGIAPSSSSLQDLQFLLVFLAIATMLVGNLSALSESNLRRMLSFSSIAQTGYMLAALSTMTVLGVAAVVFTIWNHALVKSGFFMTLGSKRQEYEDADLERLRGVGKKDKVLGFLYGSSSFAMMGAPPFGMFWSEILIVQSLLFAPSVMFSWLALVVVLNIVLSIGYYFRVVNTVVFGEPAAETPTTPRSDLVAPTSLLLLSLATGVAPFLILVHLF